LPVFGLWSLVFNFKFLIFDFCKVNYAVANTEYNLKPKTKNQKLKTKPETENLLLKSNRFVLLAHQSRCFQIERK